MDAYHASEKDREELPAMMVKRLNSLIQYMLDEVNDGNEDFAKNLEDGHVKLYKSDIQYIVKNERNIINGIK